MSNYFRLFQYFSYETNATLQKMTTFAKKKHLSQFAQSMAGKNLNRIKVMLAEKRKTNKWLAEKLGRDQATISKWCTNAYQSPLEALIQIAQCLKVNIKELIRVPEHNPYAEL